MRNLIRKILKEQEEDLNWANDLVSKFNDCEEIVQIIDTGGNYSSYLNAMSDLGVPGVFKFVDALRKKYRTQDVSNNRDPNWYRGLRDDHWRALAKVNELDILGSPMIGDICCLRPGVYKGRVTKIRRLTRIKDGKEFIMDEDGNYKPYRGKLTENVDWVEDYTRYLKVGQNFFLKSSTSPVKIKVKIIKKDDNNVWISPADMSNKRGWRGRKSKNEYVLKSIIDGSLEPIN